MWTSAYIHTNAVKDGLVKHPSQYKWSSYNDFASDRNLPIVCKDLILELFCDQNGFEKETTRLISEEKSMSRGVLDM